MLCLKVHYCIKIDGSYVNRTDEIHLDGYSYPFISDNEKDYVTASVTQFLRNLYPEHASRIKIQNWNLLS